MKTALEWAEYLPLQIKLWFIEECERQEAHFTCEYPSLVDAICGELFDWSYTEFGYEFWDFVWHIALDYQCREAEILSDYIDETIPYTKEEVEAMILEYADPNDEVCKVMLANLFDNQIKDVEQNLEDNFKPLHDNDRVWNDLMETGVVVQQIEAPKDIVKQNIEASMVSALDYFNLRSDYFDLKEKNKALLEKVQTQGDLIVKQQNEVVALKREVEALDKKEFSARCELIELKLGYQKRGSAIEAQKETIADLVKRIRTLDDTIYSQRETIKTLTQMRVAPKKEQSIFFDLLKHLNIIKK